MFKKMSLYLLIVVAHATLFSNPLPNREMIALLETINYETLDQTLNAPNVYQYREILHPLGIGGTTISFLIALYQKAAPIIANKSLIKNVIDHQNLFSDFVNLDRQTLHNKYFKYNRFRGRATLDTFRQNCQRTSRLTLEVNKMLSTLISDEKNDFDKILAQVAQHPNFQGNSFSEIKNATSNISYIKSLYLEMRMLILCSLIDFAKDWEIKQVNDDIFLLIPKDYLNNIAIKHATNTNAGQKRPLIKLTNLELELGLKIDHMRTVNCSFFEPKLLQSHPMIPFARSLEQIFVTNDDLKTVKPRTKSPFVWSIYMSGHGLPKHPQLDVLPQLYDLKKLYESKLSSASCVKTLNASPQNKNSHPKKEYAAKIKKLNNEISKAEKLKNTENKIDQGMINSLSIHEFKDVLKFLNNKINTAFFYYASCYSAGPHLIDPYSENGKPMLLNYTAMTGTPAENMSLQEFPFINIPPYFTAHYEELHEPLYSSHIDIKNKKLGIETPLRFSNFFKLLRKGAHNNTKNLILLPYSLHPHVDQFGTIIPRRIANIPLVRLAHSDHFQAMPHDKSSVVLDSTNNTNDISIDTNSGLIYSDYISGTLTLNKLNTEPRMPKLISMIPGFALHVFEEINSFTLDLKEIVNSFLTFTDLGSSKIFWIKKLTCKKTGPMGQDTETVNDVIIMRNVFNSDTLSRCSTEDPMNLRSSAYFSTDTKNETQLTWDGPFLDSYNYQIKPCSESEHKEECLNSFPQAKGYLNALLQRI